MCSTAGMACILGSRASIVSGERSAHAPVPRGEVVKTAQAKVGSPANAASSEQAGSRRTTAYEGDPLFQPVEYM